MTDTREVEKWTLLHGELVQEDDGPLVWSEDYDTLADKLAEVEEMKRLLAMDKINLRGELAGVQGKLAAVYRMALEDAVNTLRTKRIHMHTTRHEMAQDIRALPTPTAAELMARIKEKNDE